MSQYLLPVIDPSINTGSQLSLWLNLWAAAVQSNQKGASRPVDAPAGMIWIKEVSPVLQQLMVFEGVDDLVLIEWDPTTNVVSYPGAVKGPGSSDIYNIALWGGDNGDVLLDSGFEIQSGTMDNANNKVLRVGAFGWNGGAVMEETVDCDNLTIPGVYNATTAAANRPFPTTGCYIRVTRRVAGTILQEAIINNVGAAAQTVNVAYRSQTITSGVWSPWITAWDSQNLVKQPTPLDFTAGGMLPVGAFNLGVSAVAPTDMNTFGSGMSGAYFGVAGNTTLNTPVAGSFFGVMCIGGVQFAMRYWAEGLYYRTASLEAGVWLPWKQVAFTSGTTFLGETQFDSIKATGTIKSDGGQVSAADMEAFTATQLNEAGQPLPPTFLIDLENQVTALQAQITALQAQVEALTP